MSWLQRRIAASEGRYFKEEAELAAARLREKLAQEGGFGFAASGGVAKGGPAGPFREEMAEVLPEVLRHSLPMGGPTGPLGLPERKPAWGTRMSAKTVGSEGPSGPGMPSFDLGYVPRTSLGRGRWRLERLPPTVPSTANELRPRGMDARKAELLLKGYVQIVKAFVLGSALVFGGGVVGCALLARQMGVESVTMADVPAKGREFLEPRAERLRGRFQPWRAWAQQKAASWRLPEEKKQAYGEPFAERLGLPYQSQPHSQDHDKSRVLSD